jgi:hypothetical protein
MDCGGQQSYRHYGQGGEDNGYSEDRGEGAQDHGNGD